MIMNVVIEEKNSLIKEIRQQLKGNSNHDVRACHLNRKSISYDNLIE